MNKNVPETPPRVCIQHNSFTILHRSDVHTLLRNCNVYLASDSINTNTENTKNTVNTSDFAQYCGDQLVYLLEHGYLSTDGELPVLYTIPKPFELDDTYRQQDHMTKVEINNTEDALEYIYADTARIATGEMKIEDTLLFIQQCIHQHKIEIPSISSYVFLGNGILVEINEQTRDALPYSEMRIGMMDGETTRARLEKWMAVHDAAGIARPRISVRSYALARVLESLCGNVPHQSDSSTLASARILQGSIPVITFDEPWERRWGVKNVQIVDMEHLYGY